MMNRGRLPTNQALALDHASRAVPLINVMHVWFFFKLFDPFITLVLQTHPVLVANEINCEISLPQL